MFVLRRRSDGSFNRVDASNRWRLRAEPWTDDLQKAKVYRSRQAARGQYCGKHFFALNDIASGYSRAVYPCCKEIKWRSRSGYTNLCEHFKEALEKDKAAWDAKYEIVEVKLSLVE